MAVLVEKSMEKFSALMVGNPIIVLTEMSGPRVKEMGMGFPRESQYRYGNGQVRSGDRVC